MAFLVVGMTGTTGCWETEEQKDQSQVQQGLGTYDTSSLGASTSATSSWDTATSDTSDDSFDKQTETLADLGKGDFLGVTMQGIGVTNDKIQDRIEPESSPTPHVPIEMPAQENSRVSCGACGCRDERRSAPAASACFGRTGDPGRPACVA